ncbi:carboxypeptidase-like regulatory domain-containing protein [Malonomonas rubra]|uniref:carboxypeptidase-like regulatory domain-containing protein n=1 Tax=Malonomonas rubra TaxID=57040 RepID=UPI0026ED7FCF|nr:carboxypeptidase-like regulatory domain-containing protein [Malonomonas rubra]
MRFLLSLALLFNLLVGCAPQAQQATYLDGNGKSGITGKVFLKQEGQPLSGAYVNVYPSHAPNLLGPSTYISSPTDASGNYSIDVPPGQYYVVARKRSNGTATGPINPGDFFSEDARLLTEIKTGKLTKIDLPMVTMTAPMFFKQGAGDIVTEQGISGILVDVDGKPMPGGFAIAYTDNDIKRLPDFASTLSNEKGEFVLYLPKGGEYYLAARLHAWDMPRPGEPYGKYDGDVITPIQVPDKGFVKGIKMVMAPFTGTYKEGKNKRPF